MPEFVTVDDLVGWLGAPAGSVDPNRAQAVIDRATDKALVVTAPQRWEDVDPPRVVVSTILEAAGRAYRNPTGAIQKTVGDVSVSYSARSPGAVFFTTEERADLRRAAGLSNLTSVGLTSPYPPVPGRDVELGYIFEDLP